MKTNFIRQIVIAFAVIVPVYLSVFAQNSNSTVDSVNNPPLSDYNLRKLDSGAISWNSERGIAMPLIMTLQPQKTAS